ncbi:MAG TPA: hypothetical protein VK742_11845 [Candidatus Sulfotelmatobacter sp.]|jgi:hypothetical protein|nr:hypothetical protein [Candidatus Sulfotelmatobacter sp.]
MNALLFISLNLLAVAAGILVLRFWLRGRPDAEAVHLHLCNAVMWLGCMVCIAGLVLTLVQPRPSSGFSLCSTGLLVVSSMILKRRELMRRLKNRTDKKDSN